jgi:hypothetical protein
MRRQPSPSRRAWAYRVSLTTPGTEYQRGGERAGGRGKCGSTLVDDHEGLKNSIPLLQLRYTAVTRKRVQIALAVLLVAIVGMTVWQALLEREPV